VLGAEVECAPVVLTEAGLVAEGNESIVCDKADIEAEGNAIVIEATMTDPDFDADALPPEGN
jgi:hypothetical protein